MDKQESHLLHGSPFTKFSQFRAFVNILAKEVFPTPLVPVKRNAWWFESFFREFCKALTTWSWPTTSEKVYGLHVLARNT